jgi:hypothetical protein
VQVQTHQNAGYLSGISPKGETGHGKSGLPPRGHVIGGRVKRLLGKLFPQYVLAFAVFALVALLDFRLPELIGYEAIALVNLLAIVVLALFVSRGPILFGTILTGLAWNFL